MKKLDGLRDRIDRVDNRLLRMLKERLMISAQIGKIKKKAGLSALQPKRWQEVLRSRMKTGEALEMKKQFIRDLFILIHKESLRKQRGILKKKHNIL